METSPSTHCTRALALPVTLAILACALCSPPLAGAAKSGLDSSFGQGGKAESDFGSGLNLDAGKVAIAPDGKLVLVGTESSGSGGSFVVARFNKDGSPDNSFGSGGKVVTSIKNAASAIGVDIQADGKIVAGGGSLGMPFSYYTLARYNTDGSLDSGFGSGGVVTSTLDPSQPLVPAGIGNIEILSNGKILAAGSWAGILDGGTFTVARYDSNGALDTSFGAGRGWTFFAPPGGGGAQAMQVQKDGKILLAGTGGTGTQRAGYIARFTAAGVIDKSFGNQGVCRQLFAGGNSIYALAIAKDNSIFVAGSSGKREIYASVSHVSKSGSLDTKFGGTGKKMVKGFLTVTPGSGGRWSQIAFQGSGKLIIAGEFAVAGKAAWTVARISTKGKVDSTFGKAGTVNPAAAKDAGPLSGMQLQPDGKTVLAGLDSSNKPILLRLLKRGH
jgi:uncharacterized delta-60 repeat protein